MTLEQEIIAKRKEIETGVLKLAAITEKPDEDRTDLEKESAKNLEKKIAEQQVIQRTYEAKLKGLSSKSSLSTIEPFGAGLLEQPRGIRNNNPC